MVVCIAIANLFGSADIFFSITLLNHCILIFIFVSNLFKELSEKKIINLFLSLLVLYEFVTVMKLIAIILNLHQGTINYYLGGIMQIIFGILFSFININTKGFRVGSRE